MYLLVFLIHFIQKNKEDSIKSSLSIDVQQVTDKTKQESSHCQHVALDVAKFGFFSLRNTWLYFGQNRKWRDNTETRHNLTTVWGESSQIVYKWIYLVYVLV